MDRTRSRSTRRQQRAAESSRLTDWLIAAAIATVMVAGAAWWLFGRSTDGPATGGSTGASAGSSSAPTTAVSRDPLLVAGIEVLEPWADLGNIPLDTPVEHVYTLRNTGTEAVRLGDASIKVLEGC